MTLESSSSTSQYQFVSCFSAVCGPTAHSCASGFTDMCHPADSSNSSNAYRQALRNRLIVAWGLPDSQLAITPFLRRYDLEVIFPVQPRSVLRPNPMQISVRFRPE